jgi:spore coat protein U-like protein
MANGSGQYLTYGVYPSSARTTPLGSSVSASFTGNGAAQAFYAYGRVPAQTAGGFGNFTDTLTFTVTY